MATVRIFESFENLPKSYQDVFGEASSTNSFFLTLPWFRNLTSTGLGSQSRLRIYGVEPDAPGKRPYLVLPLAHDVSVKGAFARRELAAAANYYTSLFGPVIGQHERTAPEHLRLLAKAIIQDTAGWDTIDLHPMARDTPLFSDLLQAFRQAGMAVQSYFCFGNWYLPVDGRSYQEYFTALPSRLKNTLTRKVRHLANAGRLRLEIISGSDGLDRAIAAYEQVYRASWKHAEASPAFISGLIRSCAREGWLRLGVAYVDDQPAAAQIWIVSHEVASIYKLAYDEQFSNLSIGSLLTAHLMRHVIDIDRVREVDYLTGDDAYKRDWMSHRRERWGIIAFNLRTLNGTLAAIRHIGGRALKNVVGADIRKKTTA